MTPDRKLGPFGAGALVAGNMIGSGVFLLPASLASIGSITLLGWIVTTLGVLILALVFAALAKHRPEAAGLTGYVREGVGPFLGFQSVFLYWCSCWTGNVAISLAIVGYLAVFLPVLKSGLPSALAAVAAMAIMSGANLLGPRFVGRLSGLTVLLGIPPLLIVGLLGWSVFDPKLFAQSWNVSGHSTIVAVQASLAQLVWAFLGVESAAVAAKVVRNPEKNVAIATVGGVLVASIIYIAACSAIFGLLPAADLAKSTAPFADAGGKVLGATALLFVAGCALLKATGTLSGWILMTTETAKTAADTGLFPPVFSGGDRVGPPRTNMLINLCLMAGVAMLTIEPTIGRQFNTLINIAVVLTVFVYAFACLSLLRAPSARGTSGVGLALLGLGFCAWVAVLALQDPVTLKLTLGAVVLTVPLYFLRGLWARKALPVDAQPGA